MNHLSIVFLCEVQPEKGRHFSTLGPGTRYMKGSRGITTQKKNWKRYVCDQRHPQLNTLTKPQHETKRFQLIHSNHFLMITDILFITTGNESTSTGQASDDLIQGKICIWSSSHLFNLSFLVNSMQMIVLLTRRFLSFESGNACCLDPQNF